MDEDERVREQPAVLSASKALPLIGEEPPPAEGDSRSDDAAETGLEALGDRESPRPG